METEPEDDTMAPPPWHLWGNTQTLNVISPGGVASTQIVTMQMNRIAYKRPETWRWMFGARIVGGNFPNASQLTVAFDVTMGVGRSQLTARLGRFVFSPIPAPTTFAASKFSNNVNGPLQDDTVATAPNVVNTFVAQDIQVAALAQFFDATAGENVQVELTALFAPETHIRPEWFSKGELTQQFAGGETGGQ